MKILFLIPYPLKVAPSQRFRFEQYVDLLKDRGFQISFQPFWEQQTWEVLYKPTYKLRKIAGFASGMVRRFLTLFQLSGTDFVFVHRECLPVGPPLIEWIVSQVLKKKIIYDFDDAIWLPNTSHENRIAAWLKWHRKVGFICKWSYRVSCGNSFLGDFAKQFNQNVIINPSTIDTKQLHNPNLYAIDKKHNCVTVGWTGSHSTLPYLNALVPVFENLEKRFQGKWRLLVIADKPPMMNFRFLEFKPWSKKTEIADLLQFDIGIMPLTDDQWAKGKCGFKALQYMALEIPALVSPVGVNAQIVTHGVNGFLCKSVSEWTEQLVLLIENPLMRKRLGQVARKTVEENYSVESNSANFLSLFD